MIEAAILAVPERGNLVLQLQRRLGQDLPVHWDVAHVGHADAYKRAMDELVAESVTRLGVTHAMLIEDDAWPCEHFLEAATSALAYVPGDDPVTYFTRHKAPAGAGSWLKLRGGFINTQACAWPLETWTRVSAWMDSGGGRQWRWDHTYDGPPPMPRGSLRSMNADNWWSEYMRVRHMSAWATIPSLVEHRGVPSVIEGHHIGRAANYIGDDADPRSIDWSVGAPAPTRA